MLNIKNTIPPHTGEKILYAGAKPEQAKAAMILIHGRGAGAESMRSLIDLFYFENMTYIIPQAENFTWYPYRFIEKRKKNEPALSSALSLIKALVNSLNESGIPDENIYLLGFSQGACLAADFVLRSPSRYGGVFVLSGGLIGATINADDYSSSLEQTPVFFGCSDSDFHIPEQRVHESAHIFAKMNANVVTKIYPGMGHTINQDEIARVKEVINNSLNDIMSRKTPRAV